MRLLALLLLSTALVRADVWTDAFAIDKVTIPPGIDPQIGGMDTLPNGNLAICFHRGEILIYNPGANTWTQFAAGLHEPLGILAEDDHTFLVMQRPELTRIRDTNGDGVADEYETIFDGFGMSGNYHEFAFGPARDKEGNLYIALNVASNGAGVRDEVRGPWSEIGLEREKMLSSQKDWKSNKGKAGRMYSRVPYRGWVMKLSPDGKKWEPFASGFRSPEGLGFDSAGRLMVTDNQGDWLGTSKVHHVRKGHFHGHPASLVWNEGWTRNPLEVPVAELEEMRTPAMGLLPQGELANSPTQPLLIPDGTFGPLAGQMLIGEMNQPTLVRFLPDAGSKVSQGAAIPFLQFKELGIGNHRMTFTDDGSLWIGKTHLSWAGSEGLVRVKLKEGKTDLFAVTKAQINKGGIILGLSTPADAGTLGGIEITEHTYHYHAAYGSPKIEEKKVEPAAVTLNDTKDDIFIGLDKIREGFIYTISLPKLRSATGQALLGDKVYYTIHATR